VSWILEEGKGNTGIGSEFGHDPLIDGFHASGIEQNFNQFHGKFHGRSGASAGDNISIHHDPVFGIGNVLKLVLDRRMAGEIYAFKQTGGLQNNRGGANGGNFLLPRSIFNKISLTFSSFCKLEVPGGPSGRTTLSNTGLHTIRLGPSGLNWELVTGT
jgi:hypothetical protein